MKILFALVKRNVKLFFRDKGMFFTSLITPAILLVLYATFLGGIYRDSFASSLPDTSAISDEVVEGLVGGQLISSILAVSCVTVAFCSNFLMVQDKANGTIRDLKMTPVRPSALSMGYYAATLLSTLIVCFAATGVCLAYVAVVGWYLSAADVLLLFLDVLLLSLFGTGLSSVINCFLSTQGQISAVGAIISAGYGFLCGAYMPIASFGEELQRVLWLLPGTYGTSLIRNHAMRGAFAELQSQGVPAEIVGQIRQSLDCSPSVFGRPVGIPAMYLILGVAAIACTGLYILLHAFRKKTN